MRTKQYLAVIGCVLAIGAVFCPESWAAAYPKQPINIIVHTKPGGISDVGARQIQQSLTKANLSPVPLLVENKTGGGGAVAIASVVQARNPDYNILSVTNTHITSMLTSNPPYTLKDLKPLCYIAAEPMAIGVNAGRPWKTLKDFFDDARANPGKYSMGAAQVGSAAYIIASKFKKELGLDYTVVPFDAVGEMVTTAAGNHIDIIICEPYMMTSQAKAGNIRMLAVFTPTRLSGSPDVPTIIEAGYKMPAVEKFRGFMVSKKISPEAEKFMFDLFSTRLQADQNYLKLLADNNQLPKVMSPEQFGAFLDGMIEETRAALEPLGLLKKK